MLWPDFNQFVENLEKREGGNLEHQLINLPFNMKYIAAKEVTLWKIGEIEYKQICLAILSLCTIHCKGQQSKISCEKIGNISMLVVLCN